MASTSTRTLRLLSLLQARRYWPGAELAGRLQVSPRTLRRDIERLRELRVTRSRPSAASSSGYQLAARHGAAAAVSRGPGGRRPGYRPASGRAERGRGHRGVLGARASQSGPGSSPARLRRRAEALGAMTVPASVGERGPGERGPGHPHHRRAGLPGQPNITRSPTPPPTASTLDRHVEPHRLVLLGRRWYLAGYDLAGTEDSRSFRLDRLTAPRSHGDTIPATARCPPPRPHRFPPGALTASAPHTTLRSSSRLRPRPCASGSASGLPSRTLTPPAAGSA